MGVQRLKPAAGGATVKSMQRGTISINGATLSGTATISAVATANAELRFIGFTTATGGAPTGDQFPRIDLTNSTTVTATKATAPGGATIVVGFEVTEWQQ